jgi:hypothetical protein
MRFRLVLPDRKTLIHEGILPLKAGDTAEIISWGNRGFRLIEKQHDLWVYVEAPTYRIGGAFGA